MDVTARLLSRFCLSAAAIAFAFVAAGSRADAQQNFPGFVITTPSPAVQTPEVRKPKRRAAPKKRKRRTVKRRAAPKPRKTSKLAIVMLVNDSPITNFEIEERAKLMALSGDVGKRAAANFKALVSNPRTNERLKAILQRTISENQGQPRQVIVRIFERRKKAFAQRLRQRAVSSARRAAVSGMKRRAREELIAERLKVQEAKRLGVTVSKERIDKAFADVAKRNGKTAAEFAKQLRGSGASSHTMKAKFKAQIAWAAVLGRRFRRLVSVSQRDVDDFLGQRSSGDASRVQLALITLPVRDILDQQSVARRLSEGDSLRRQFRDCGSASGLASGISGAKFQNLGTRDPNKLSEPTRSMALSANGNEMLPPTLGKNAVEVYIVCGKSTASGSFEARQSATRQLERREIEILGRRHLADLRRDAHIEIR